jgi:hypothetical protein
MNWLKPDFKMKRPYKSGYIAHRVMKIQLLSLNPKLPGVPSGLSKDNYFQMKKTIILLVLLAGIAGCATTRNNKTLTKVMTLKIGRPGGINGTAVAWDSVRKKYYTAFSGNKSFPMVVFNEQGKVQSNDTLKTMFDVRGLWYNTTTNTLQTNGFKDGGLAEYALNDLGIPTSVTKLAITDAQPNEQCVGAYDQEENMIYYYDSGSTTITKQDFNGGHSSKQLYLGVKKKSSVSMPTNAEVRGFYNANACIYTGMRKAQIGLLNVKDRQIELYNLKTGLLRTVIQIPDEIPIEPSLNFSYSHDIFWFFDRKRREWRGYHLAVMSKV